MRSKESEGNFIRRHARGIVFAASLATGLGAGAVAIEKAEKAIDLNNQIHALQSAEELAQIDAEYFTAYWTGVYALAISVGLFGAAGYSAVEAVRQRRATKDVSIKS